MLKSLINKITPSLQKRQTRLIQLLSRSERKDFNGNLKKFIFFTATTSSGVLIYFLYDQSVGCYSSAEKQKLVILGSGWASISLIKSLKPGQYDITVVSPTNYFLYSPLLPSVTVGTVDARSLVEPVRKILWKKHGNDVCFVEAECVDVDIEKKKIICQDTSGISGGEITIPYDKLVVGVGSKTATRNVKGIEKYAHMLKTVEHANSIRNDIMDSFETASLPGQSDEEIRRLLTFVVVGGGPTGVEFAGELRDFMHNLKKFYPQSIMDKVSVTLVNSHFKVLSMYDKEISDFAESKFSSNNINMVKNSYVVELTEKELKIKNKTTKKIESLPYGICVWAAGVAPREITQKMITKIPGQNNRNALVIDNHLRIKHTTDIFGLGDCATVEFSKLIDNVEELYKQADTDGSGELCLNEFTVFVENAMKTYPEMTEHLRKVKKHISKKFDELDTDKNERLSFAEFESFLLEVDNKLKAYPATAQVAAQQGKYLGKLLNSNPTDINTQDFKGDPFHYSHLGSFAYVGGERAVLQLPIVGSVTNWATMWLWRAAYLNQAVSWRMELLIGLDWVKTHVFGRDTSRI